MGEGPTLVEIEAPAGVAEAKVTVTSHEEADRDHYKDESGRLALELRAALAQVEALKKALVPFAKIAPSVEHTDLRDGDVVHRQRTPTGYAELTKDDFRRAVAALAGTTAESSPCPEGWVLVPREPTEDMLRECFHAVTKRTLGEHNCMMLTLADRRTAHDFKAKMRWRAMLAAAPTPAEARTGQPAMLDAVEVRAEQIYNGWGDVAGWVPWVPGGNSTRQDDARRQARSEQAEGEA